MGLIRQIFFASSANPICLIVSCKIPCRCAFCIYFSLLQFGHQLFPIVQVCSVGDNPHSQVAVLADLPLPHLSALVPSLLRWRMLHFRYVLSATSCGLNHLIYGAVGLIQKLVCKIISDVKYTCCLLECYQITIASFLNDKLLVAFHTS